MFTVGTDKVLFLPRMMRTLSAILLCALIGCATSGNNTIVGGTTTVLGVQIAQNPATQLYEAKFGYSRAELLVVPRPTNGAPVPDVVSELRFNNIFQGGGLYQRLAIGQTAVANSVYLFAKDGTGSLNPNTAAAITAAVRGIPANSADATSILLPLAKAYADSTNKAVFDKVAKTQGFTTFRDFLTAKQITREAYEAIVAELRVQRLLP
jgi:hypothetical protein